MVGSGWAGLVMCGGGVGCLRWLPRVMCVGCAYHGIGLCRRLKRGPQEMLLSSGFQPDHSACTFSSILWDATPLPSD
ncbi:hypothetical protein BCR34DRAFT_567237 [Clohesyomyces aquaticus]|uniref:Secreted protein n=1 Tax=Clohesyomyces aquaticus TaxID=1231657 RepID=A0A1Y1ZK13_9PLEO|nr:hypothetical protein BCR34DRAFT_567237 [Clohesyomyces aquaticus]